MKLAVVSPLPPDRSGVADFTARLIEELRRRCDVDARRRADTAWLRHADERLYQIGNNSLHAGAYDAALAVPGVVELHDAVLHHFLLGRLGRDAYIAEHVYNFGEWAATEAAELWERRGRASSDEAFFARPLIKRVVNHAKKVIVHNPAAAAAVEAVRPEAPLVEIPHFADIPDPPSEESRSRTRATLGIADDELLVGSFGYQRPSKRLRSLLRAAERLEIPHRILIAGEFVSSDYESSLSPWLRSSKTIRRGRTPEAEFQALAAACDVGVNLRSPAAGESSGIAIRLMGLARPLIVSAGPETSTFPDSAVIRVDPGEAEEAMLAASLDLLGRHPELRRSLGEAARNHLLERHAMPRVLELYSAALGPY